jgi:hypothetical protein
MSDRVLPLDAALADRVPAGIRRRAVGVERRTGGSMTTATISIPKGRVRSPWMGIPQPGTRPLVLSTEQVRAALAGVTVTDRPFGRPEGRAMATRYLDAKPEVLV